MSVCLCVCRGSKVIHPGHGIIRLVQSPNNTNQTAHKYLESLILTKFPNYNFMLQYAGINS